MFQIVSAFEEFTEVLKDFVDTLLPFELGAPIMILVGIILALAAWRIIS